MTPTDLETYVRQRYNAVGDNFYPQAEIFNFFYAGQVELALETECIKHIYTTTSVLSQRAYDIPSLAISISRIEYDGEKIFPNDLIDDDSYTNLNTDDTSTGRPKNYQEYGDTVFLRPIPDTAGLTIKMYTYDLPDVPTAAGTLDVPARYHMMLADYALYCMAFQDNNSPVASAHLQLWNAHKNAVKAVERKRKVADQFRIVKDRDDLAAELRFY